MKTCTKAVIKKLAAFFCLLLFLALPPASASARIAVDTGRPTSLTILCEYKGEQMQGVRFDLYKVADMNAVGEFTLTEDFAGYAISLEQDGAADWDALGETLAQYARRDSIPTVGREITDEDGEAKFTGLRVGMYLVYGHRHASEGHIYTPKAFLVSLPGLDEEDIWVYDVTAKCKGEGRALVTKPISVKALKVWEDNGHASNRPEMIEAQLLKDGVPYETVALNADNSWRYTWADLPSDSEWSVVEKTVPENYTVRISREGTTYVLTNTYTPTFTAVEVEKQWNDSGHENKRPAAIEVQLLRDGAVFETVSLNAANNWLYAWRDLERGHDWEVKEKSRPAGYTASIKQEGGRFIIVNTYASPKLPQTGQLWWPIPVLLCAGLGFYVLALLWRKPRKSDGGNEE